MEEGSQQYDRLRPLERRILQMQADGVPVEGIAERLNKSPRFVERVIEWIRIPRSGGSGRAHPTPMQRVVLARRAKGESHESIGRSFKRSGRFIRQVEGHAHFQEGVRLLTTSSEQARSQLDPGS